ncbi:MAG: hypothetical protein LBL21_03495 [Rickettsiales bacterium]|jgi:hypothetical protein|nr:hypothetical protein [Rickettsiales bacterium]
MKKLFIASIFCALAAPFAAFAGVVDDLNKECEDFKTKYTDYDQIVCEDPFSTYIGILKAEQEKIIKAEANAAQKQSGGEPAAAATAVTLAVEDGAGKSEADVTKSKEIIEQLLKIATDRGFYELFQKLYMSGRIGDNTELDSVADLTIEEAKPEILNIITNITPKAGNAQQQAHNGAGG